MPLRSGSVMAIALLATVGAMLTASPRFAPPDGLQALDGEWIFVEDRTVGRAVEQQQPSMSARVRLRVEDGAVVLIRRDREIRIALDGSASEVPGKTKGAASRYRGEWKDGALRYDAELLRTSDNSRTGLIRTELRVTADGMLARVQVDPPTGMDSVALYRHPKDIALPAPAEATAADLAWLAGPWVGVRGAASIEERWSPPLGGAMLGVSRTVSRDRMVAFEFLRIVERDGGLVYVAQPNGVPPTEFVLTESGKSRAVFENPRHDSPQRIVYELSAEGRLNASIGFIKGGRPQRFEYKREGN
ncbi:MAG: hypothetical protein K1X57_17835 [Gemmataceae bacterium]|nr:hypothetical protein [Gemmataceae bacterium]